MLLFPAYVIPEFCFSKISGICCLSCVNKIIGSENRIRQFI